jgi:site-specific recombinase XerD
MTGQARSELAKARRAALSDHVIEWAGKPIKDVKKAFSRAVAKAGLGSDVTPHVLRHTAAVWMVEDGVPMPEVPSVPTCL